MRGDRFYGLQSQCVCPYAAVGGAGGGCVERSRRSGEVATKKN